MNVNMSWNLTLSWSFAALVKYETSLDKNMNIVRSEREHDTVLVLYSIYKFIYKHFADCQNSFPFQRYWQNHWRFEHSQYCEEWTWTWYSNSAFLHLQAFCGLPKLVSVSEISTKYWRDVNEILTRYCLRFRNIDKTVRGTKSALAAALALTLTMRHVQQNVQEQCLLEHS